MEANFFRYLLAELESCLLGCRIQNVYEPLPGIWNFKLASDRNLIYGRTHLGTFLTLSRVSPENPPEPSPKAMWLRKRLKNRRIQALHSDWTGRRAALSLSPEGKTNLIVQPGSTPELSDELAPAFYQDPAWPDYDTILSDDRIWRQFPQISPPLRKTLAFLDRARGEALLRQLETMDTTRFSLQIFPSGKISFLPWIPPQQLRQDRELTFDSAIEAAEKGYFHLLPEITGTRKQEQKQKRASRKRAERNLEKTTEDLERMRALAADKHKGILIQQNLYQLDHDAKEEKLILEDASGQSFPVVLDPKLTIKENMERFFKLAAKGERGIRVLSKRRAELESVIETESWPAEPKGGFSKARSFGGPQRTREEKAPAVKRYRTSDGFLLLRGKNNTANHKLLTRFARGHDLWFHAQDGPGAHLLLKRDHPGQEVPERSLQEAASIAGLFSYFKNERRARVICAEVRHVRTIKGAPPGEVRVDQIVQVFDVSLDEELEQRLAT
ncbi:MAG: NFACT RNA binding domain-containing protein [Desulfovibrionales bacterium]